MPRPVTFEGKTYNLPDGTTDQEALDFVSSQHPATTTPPQDHSLEDAAWNFGWPNIVNGIGQALKSGQRMVGIHKAFTGATQVAAPFALPALVAAPAATIGGLAAGTLGNTIGKYGSEFLGASPEASDLIGDAGSLVGGGLGSLTAESPRLRGYISGTAKAPIQALRAAASVKSGNLHGLGSAIAAIGDAPSEGAKGKLWLGDVGRGIRDFMFPPTTAPMSGVPSTPGLSNISSVGRVPTEDELAFESAPKYLKLNSASASEMPNRFYKLPGTKPVAKPPVLPDLRSSSYQPLSNPNAVIDPVDTNSLLVGKPLTGGPKLTPEPTLPGPEEMAARIAAQKAAAAPQIPTQATLDAAAKRIGFKSYAETPPGGARTMVEKAARIWEETTGPAPTPKGVKPRIQPVAAYTPPGTAGVLASDVTPVATLPDLSAPTPQAAGTAPIQLAGNNINYPANVHEQLHAAGPEVAITHGTNASAKDLAVAARLKNLNITPEAMDAMPDTELNKHYTDLGYKKLGSDYAPGKRVGRDAVTGRAHLRNVLDSLWK